MLVRENKALEVSETEDEATRVRIEDAARLEGIDIEEAHRRKRGFRYLY